MNKSSIINKLIPGCETQSTSTDETSIFIRPALGPFIIDPHLGWTAFDDPTTTPGFCGDGATGAEFNSNQLASEISKILRKFILIVSDSDSLFGTDM